ncbi:MAG: iron-containing alcohol dehydrogenase [Spirochaetaceae bacterium]|nr:iron-containing alcohol dehydrogenase [Spirochaetaceae bacterium]
MTDIVFSIDPEIVVGVDTINRAGLLCKKHCKRALIMTERALYENKSLERLTTILGDSGVESIVFDEISSQITAEVAQNIAVLARGARCELIISLGGLKTQALARFAAILVHSSNDIFDLLDGKEPGDDFLPCLSIPTSGRDPFIFTNYCIITDPRNRAIKQIKCPSRLCVGAIFDGGLIASLDGKFAPAIAFDGFSTVLEAYCSRKSSLLSDALLEQALDLYIKIIHAYRNHELTDITEIIINAGLLMALGIAISAPGPGLALAYSLNSRFPLSKSLCSTILLPCVIEKLISCCPEKIASVAVMMGEAEEETSTIEKAQKVTDAIIRYRDDLHLPVKLKEYSSSLDRLIPVIDSMRNMNFIAFSPWTVTAEDAFALLKQAF